MDHLLNAAQIQPVLQGVNPPGIGVNVNASPTPPTGASPAAVGIHCSNEDCKTRTGERSRGHQSCRWLLCGHCCQTAARAVAERGEDRPNCKVHSRRVHTGHRPLPRDGSQSHLSDIHDSELEEQLEKRNKLEQVLKRSITLVVWYKNNSDPLRLSLELTTFPLFRFVDFPELIAEFKLTPNSYIDAYNEQIGQWEQHKLNTVKNIDQRPGSNIEPRVLYRLRPSLLEALNECPGLNEEIALLTPPPPPMFFGGNIRGIKRPFDDVSNGTPTGKAARNRASGGSPQVQISNPGSLVLNTEGKVVQPWTPAGPQGVNAPMNTPGGPGNAVQWDFSSIVLGPTPFSTPNTKGRPANIAPPPGMSHMVPPPQYMPAGPIPPGMSPADGPPQQHPRRFPTDYTVRQIIEGFGVMAQMQQSTPSLRQRNAFERIFGCRYVKSTVGRAKLYWKRASKDIRDYFMNMPEADMRGVWANFVRVMDGRGGLSVESGSGEGGQTHMIGPMPGQEAVGQLDHQDVRDDNDDDEGDDEDPNDIDDAEGDVSDDTQAQAQHVVNTLLAAQTQEPGPNSGGLRVQQDMPRSSSSLAGAVSSTPA